MDTARSAEILALHRMAVANGDARGLAVDALAALPECLSAITSLRRHLATLADEADPRHGGGCVCKLCVAVNAARAALNS